MPDPSHKRLRVLQVCHDPAGPFVDVCRLYNEPFRDHHTTTVYLAGSPDADVSGATGADEVLFLGESDLRGIKWSTLFKLARVFRARQFDVVIAHRYKAIYAAGVMSAFFTIPVLFGVAHEHAVFRRPTRALFLSLWRPNIVVLGVSDAVCRDVLADVPSLVAGERVFRLHHAIDLDRASDWPARDAARAELGIADDVFVVGSIGRLVTKKGFDVLLDGFASMPESDAVLVIIGEGRLRAELTARSTRLGIADRVVFAGYRAGAARLIRAFDTFVLASGTAEAFGLVLLEAMLAGVPVVTSDAAGPVEVVGETGLTFRSGDAAALCAQLGRMRNMARDERDHLTARASARVRESFSLAAFRQRFWELPPMAAVQRGLERDA